MDFEHSDKRGLKGGEEAEEEGCSREVGECLEVVEKDHRWHRRWRAYGSIAPVGHFTHFMFIAAHTQSFFNTSNVVTNGAKIIAMPVAATQKNPRSARVKDDSHPLY